MIKAQYDLDLSPMERLKAAGIRKALRIATNRAAAPVKAVAVSKAQAVGDKGNLAKSLRIKVKVYGAFGDRTAAIVGPSRKFKRMGKRITRGPKKGEKRLIRPSRYAHLVEWGSKRSRAKPWLKPTQSATSGRYLEDVRREVAAELARELARRAT